MASGSWPWHSPFAARIQGPPPPIRNVAWAIPCRFGLRQGAHSRLLWPADVFLALVVRAVEAEAARTARPRQGTGSFGRSGAARPPAHQAAAVGVTRPIAGAAHVRLQQSGPRPPSVELQRCRQLAATTGFQGPGHADRADAVVSIWDTILGTHCAMDHSGSGGGSWRQAAQAAQAGLDGDCLS